ncbi:MAG: hypothetical protein HUU50_23060 [Candidatus Brocadiae bacterium]|nr:hypothetical protein [Candidatus Brocadiia bacterium]
MKKTFIWILLTSVAFSFLGCQSAVVYDDITDSFRYKPECEFDYINSLSPQDRPAHPCWE